MELHDFLRLAHRLLSKKHPSKLTQYQMAKLINISHRTYVEYVRGTHRPIGMRAMLDLLCLLEQQDRESLLQSWLTSRQSKTASASKSTVLSHSRSSKGDDEGPSSLI